MSSTFLAIRAFIATLHLLPQASSFQGL
jgi:hypothetical protein